MAIYNDCKIVIDLNKLVKARPCGVDLHDEHVDYIANDLSRSMTFDSLFGQVDTAIWEYADECGIDLSDSEECQSCLLYTSPSPRDRQKSRMPSSA